MSTSRPSFMPVTADMDANLEQLAAEKGIPQIVKPQARGGGEPAYTPPAQPAEPPRAELKNINFQGPEYLRTALRMKAAETDRSIRTIIMLALRKDGFRVDEADLGEDVP